MKTGGRACRVAHRVRPERFGHEMTGDDGRARRTSDICFVTATTERFVPGALTTVGSFLRHHPGFDGDVVVVHDGLARRSFDHLGALSDRVRFEPVAPDLRARMAAGLAIPPGRLAELYTLEAFRLTGYRKVLFCDADVLFRQPIDELFDTERELVCCGDAAHLRGLRLDAATFAPTDAPDALERTFNSGFLLIDGRVPGERVRAELLAHVAPQTWRGMQAPHTDQLVLNRCLAGRQTLVGWTYNYLLALADEVERREGLPWRAAKVLHFNLSLKPWMPNASRGAPAGLRAAYRLWREAWLHCVATAHLRLLRRDGLRGGA